MDADQDKPDQGKQLFRILGLLFLPVGALCLLIGLGSLGFGWVSYQADQAAKQWPVVEGQITEASVRESTSRDSGGYEKHHFTPEVVYEFQVEGESYTSNRLTPSFQTSYSDATEAQAVLATYPKGLRVEVHYDPQDPNQAALDVEGGSPAAWLAGILGACFALGGLFFGGLGLFLYRKIR